MTTGRWAFWDRTKPGVKAKARALMKPQKGQRTSQSAQRSEEAVGGQGPELGGPVGWKGHSTWPVRVTGSYRALWKGEATWSDLHVWRTALIFWWRTTVGGLRVEAGRSVQQLLDWSRRERDGGKEWSELENISINPTSLTLLQGVEVWESFGKKKHILMPSLPYHRTTSYALLDCTA